MLMTCCTSCTCRLCYLLFFFFSSRRRHTRFDCDWSSDVCSSDLGMLRIRMIEERIKALYAEQEMRCPTHFSIGQEAAAVGVCARLTREDLITSAHRSHAHYLSKGGDLQAMLAELYASVTGNARGKSGAMPRTVRA